MTTIATLPLTFERAFRVHQLMTRAMGILPHADHTLDERTGRLRDLIEQCGFKTHGYERITSIDAVNLHDNGKSPYLSFSFTYYDDHIERETSGKFWLSFGDTGLFTGDF